MPHAFIHGSGAGSSSSLAIAMEHFAAQIQVLADSIQVMESVLGKFQAGGGAVEVNFKKVRALVDTNFDQVQWK